jgi:hypothetical protein
MDYYPIVEQKTFCSYRAVDDPYHFQANVLWGSSTLVDVAKTWRALADSDARNKFFEDSGKGTIGKYDVSVRMCTYARTYQKGTIWAQVYATQGTSDDLCPLAAKLIGVVRS